MDCYGEECLQKFYVGGGAVKKRHSKLYHKVEKRLKRKRRRGAGVQPPPLPEYASLRRGRLCKTTRILFLKSSFS